ncbi:MAG: NapC/NirT family cytochrome c [Candidatus Thiodiazotropha sp. (ex Dulcina madagascariensis)]|nr:NapC/NirT family cytochrome c [Candidatus Thiodiazotropha sp. (ex Dulcina madagascariensis)]MCU7928851.1 NapC/NirT family cytochrome c [Candidatus Thiodiazotropha sp. (ex Dulcina madagascariensis)]
MIYRSESGAEWTVNSGAGIQFRISWRLAGLIVAAILLFLSIAYGGVEYYTSQSSFCGGSCHTMTEQYEAWQSNYHHQSNNPQGMQAECVDCHFLPGKKHSLKAKYEGLRHLAAYLYDRDAPLPIRPVIKDGACLQSGCHNRQTVAEKEIQYTERVRFKHQVHFTDKALDGHRISCDTCHFKTTEDKHFEVPEDICFLCHLKLKKPTLDIARMSGGDISKITFEDRPSIDFNKGASRCDICHTIPARSLQSQLRVGDESTTKKPITHQTIQASGVACEGCHFDVVKGAGEIDTGNVVSNGCLTCHNRSQTLLATAGDKGLMHDKHIPDKADCFDCHSVIEHKNRTDHLDFVRRDCQLCHVDQHKYQKQLLAGIPVDEDISGTPHLMYEVNTNCMACHLKKTVSRGHDVRTAAGDTCAACHTEQHRKMLDDWKTSLEKEVAGAEEVEAEARGLLAELRNGLNKEQLSQAEAMIAKGSELINTVRVGNGVHNKKYAITILDGAFGNFEDTIELLEGIKSPE